MSSDTSTQDDATDDVVRRQDVGLPRSMDDRLRKTIAEKDPFAESEAYEGAEGSNSSLHALAEMTGFHPFMRLFNMCARSMYLDESKGKRMRMLSVHHPLFRRCCMIGDFIFTTICAFIIILAVLYVFARIADVPMPWTPRPCCS